MKMEIIPGAIPRAIVFEAENVQIQGYCAQGALSCSKLGKAKDIVLGRPEEKSEAVDLVTGNLYMWALLLLFQPSGCKNGPGEDALQFETQPPISGIHDAMA